MPALHERALDSKDIDLCLQTSVYQVYQPKVFTGTYSSDIYTGCRCQHCKEANRLHMREYRTAKKAQMADFEMTEPVLCRWLDDLNVRESRRLYLRPRKLPVKRCLADRGLAGMARELAATTLEPAPDIACPDTQRRAWSSLCPFPSPALRQLAHNQHVTPAHDPHLHSHPYSAIGLCAPLARPPEWITLAHKLAGPGSSSRLRRHE